MSEWKGFVLYPRGLDAWSNDVTAANAVNWFAGDPTAPNLLITLFDVWIYKGEQWDKVNKIASWTPIDHMPLPPAVQQWLMRPNVEPIAMSKFGVDMLEKAGFRDVIYVPHGIEPDFKPTKVYEAGAATMTPKDMTKVDDDRFMVLMVAANKGQAPCRKAFPEAFLAFAAFAEKHDDAVLFLYTEEMGAMGGINLRELAQACGIKPHQIQFMNQYAYRQGLPHNAMATLYTRADVLLAPSMGEGFGIPVVEAQACGLPVIVSNFSAQPELVGDGWLVNGQPYWEGPQKSWLQTPDVSQIVRALNEAYERPRELSQKAIDFASQYQADYVFDTYWKPALKRLV
jgi:glycosyltransferase involved in cell wall biosynthesis